MHFPINSCERPLFAAPCSRYFYDEITSVVHRHPSQIERENTTTPGITILNKLHKSIEQWYRDSGIELSSVCLAQLQGLILANHSLFI